MSVLFWQSQLFNQEKFVYLKHILLLFSYRHSPKYTLVKLRSTV